MGTNVGLPGGYPDTSGWTPVTPSGLDVTGATDSSVGIINAITAAGTTGTVISLPATPGGFLKIDFQLFFQNKRKIVIRGAVDVNGAPTTLLQVSPGQGCVAFGSVSRDSGATITSGLSKGSTALVLSSGASSYSAGDLILVSVDNDNAVPVISVNGFGSLRRQVTRVTSVNYGTQTLSIFPALYGDYTIGANVTRYTSRNEYIGIENISCDLANTNGPGVKVVGGYACWVKNCNFQHVLNYFLLWYDSLQCQVSHCRLDIDRVYPLPNGGGIMLFTACGLLVDDNIVYQAFPGFEINDGSSGNVIAYNFVDYAGGKAINSNHSPHNQFNLYEGNALSSTQCDGYFGSCSRDSYFRNLTTGVDAGTPTSNTTLNRFTRDYAYLGNLMATPSFGNPNLGNSDFVGTTNSNGWKDWNSGSFLTGTITTRTSDTEVTVTFDGPNFEGQLSDTNVGDLEGHNIGSPGITVGIYWNGRINSRSGVQVTASGGVNPGAHTVKFEDSGSAGGDVYPTLGSHVQITTGSGGFQELDGLVESSTHLYSNYYNDTGDIPVGQRLGSDTIANTVAYLAETGGHPAWWDFGHCPTFPPYDSTAPAPAVANIPAGYRFVQFTPPVQTSAFISSSGTGLSVIINKPVTVGGGGAGAFTVSASAGAVTATYSAVAGSTIFFTLSRVITDAEVVTVSFVQPGDGWQDANTNALPSFSNLTAQNNSGQTSGATYIYTTDPANAVLSTSYDSHNNVDGIFPIVFPQSGFVTAMGVYLQSSFGTPYISFKGAIYDASLNLLASGSGSFTPIPTARFVSCNLDSSVHVTSGLTYYLVVKFNSDSDPVVLYQSRTLGDLFYWLGNSYSSFPDAAITLQFQGTAMYSIRAKLIPDVGPITKHRRSAKARRYALAV